MSITGTAVETNIRLLVKSPDYTDTNLTIAQAETYRLLSALEKVKKSWSNLEIMKFLGLRDPRPVMSRINHLAEKGWLEIA